MAPYTIKLLLLILTNNLYFEKDALKSAEEPPDINCQHHFEPGAGCGG